jgi:hypothetical protein
MPIQNQPSQGLSQNVTIRQGRVTSKDKSAEVGAVVKVNRGQEGAAWGAAQSNGADDIRFRTDSGDTYIASGVGFEKLKLQLGNTVDLNGVKGRVLEVNNEMNSKTENKKMAVVAPLLGLAGGAGMGLFGGLVTGSVAGLVFEAAAAPVFMGTIAVGAVAGAIYGFIKRVPVVNLDAIKLFGSEVQ